jgi:hypothetical protein
LDGSLPKIYPVVRPFDQDGPNLAEHRTLWEIHIKISSPLFSIFSLVAILVGSRDHRTLFWKGAIQGSFHKNLVAIGPVEGSNSITKCEVGKAKF